MASTFALAGCTTQIQKLNGFRSSVGFSTLTVSSNLLDFGNVNVHATSAPTTVTFTNELVGGQGAGAVTCSAPSLGDPLNFSVVSANCGSIAQGASCSIVVDAEPAARGVSQTTLAMTCTDSRGTSQLISTLVRVNGVEIVLAVSPMSHDFGTVTVGGNSATQDFTFSNSGNIPATSCSAPTITDSVNFTLVANTCGTNDLVAGGSCLASIRANPTSPGGVATTLSRTCTVGGTVSTTTNLIIATGATTSLAWSPLTHDFGSVNVGSNSAGQTFTLANTGGAAATGCSAPSLSDSTNFTITADGCGTSDLAAVTGTCAVTVRANPTATGAKSTTLSRTCSFGGTVSTTANQIVTNGIAPALAWSPLTKDFGNVNVGANSSTQTFTLTNSGTATATGCSAPALSNSTDFTIVTDNCGTNTLAGSGTTCTVDVRANPASTGAKAATLSRSCTFGGGASTTANQIVTNGVSASLAWSPMTKDFGNVNVGANSSTQTFTLTNSGGASATGCSAPTLSNSTDFAIVTDGCGTANLAGSNATCTVDVRANPTSAGAKATTLSRTCTVGGSAATTTNQIVTNGVAPALAWSPLTKDFGNVNVGSNSSTQTFTLTNSGTATATGCSAPSITDTTNFTLVTDNCGTNTLAGSGATCTVDVRANPTATGAMATTLSRTCTFGGSPSTTANQIVVAGVAPALAWSPMTKDFGNVNVGSNSSLQTFTLTNSGTATATGCSAPSITDTTNFTLVTDNCGTNTLAGSGATCTVDVRANPTTMGAKATTLSRTCTFGGSPSTTANQIVANGQAVDLAFDLLTHDFGAVGVGSSSANQVFTLQNFGNLTASGCAAPALSNATDFEIVSETCGTANVAPSGTCTVTVRAIPQSSGSKATTLSRTCSVGGTPATTTNGLTTNAVQPSLAWSPMTKDFGNVNVGSNSSTQTFTLTNSGGASATGCSAPSITDTANFTLVTDNCGTADLAGSGATCTVDVRANPTSAGAKATTLSRTCTVGGTPTTTANQIVANGLAPALAWSPMTKDFGNVNVGANSSTQTFTLTNSGGATATGCSAPALSNATDFTIVTDGCATANLAGSNATCTVDVRANPTSAGAKATTLSRTCTYGGSAATTANQIVTNGVAPALAWSPLTKDFGNVNVGSNSSTQTFTLTNSGTATATGCSAPTLSNSTDFAIVTDGCGTANLAGSNTTCTVDVRANPTSTGAKATTLSRTCTFGGSAATTTDQIVANGIAPALDWSPLTRNFGNVNVGGSSAQTFTLTNSGTATATGCSAPTITNSTDFTLANDLCGTNTLAGSGTTCTIQVRATPASAGTKTATLSRTCTFGGTAATTTDQIVVNGLYPSLAWSPTTYDFGSVNVGSNSSTQTFTLTNSGNGNATSCSAPTIADTTNFTITADTCSTGNLNSGGSTCTVQVRANPTTAGAISTTLSRTCGFGGTASTNTNGISVTGTSPSLAWSPMTKDFGNVNQGTNSSLQTFTLTNSGTATATGCSAPSITDTTNFTLVTDNCGTNTLAGSGATCTVDVRANPASTGAKSTTLSRTCTFGGSASTTANQIVANGIYPSLAWSPMTKDFGNVNVGSNSSTQTFTLTNSGTATATGCSAPALSNSTDFTIVTDNCGTNTLAGASATCTVDVRANPTTVGAKATTLSRTCTFGGSAATTTNQIVTVGIAPSLAWSPLTKDFGNVNQGTNSSLQTFTLTNSGTATATGCSAPALSNTTDFTIVTDNCGTNTLAGANATCTVDVRGNPASTGAKTATLSRTCTFGGSASTTTNGIVVTGVYPNLAWSPLTNNFGNIAYAFGKSGSVTFTFTNSGTGDATGCSAPTLAGTNPTQFEISIDNCGTANLAVGASCTVNVRTNLTGTGLKKATLSRVCSFGGTKTTTADQIRSTGVASGASLYAGSWTDGLLGLAYAGRKTADQYVYFTNRGTASATGCTAPSVTNTTDFTIVSTDCGASLAVGAGCSVKVRGNPASGGGDKTGTLSLSCTGTSATKDLTTTQDDSYPVQISLGSGDMLMLTNNSTLRYTGWSTWTYWGATSLNDVTQVSAGNGSMCARRSGGGVACSGWNGYGQLGNGTTTDEWGDYVSVSGISTATQVSMGQGGHACALLSGGSVKCWGNNNRGQLGNNTTTDSTTPVSVSGISTATAISVGDGYACAVLSGGTAKCWGANDSGQLGDGTATDRKTPVPVRSASGVTLANVSNITGGEYTTCAVLTDATIRCWGMNQYGGIGNGSTSDRHYADQGPSGITNGSKVAPGYLHTCAMLTDGTAKCWGQNGQAQLGDGTVTQSLTPVTVTGLSGATDISTADKMTCALTSGNEVKCWGDDVDGHRGIGIDNTKPVPTAIPGLSGVTQVAAGETTSCALINDGTVKCWGYWAADWEAGPSGDNTNVATPTTVTGLSGVSQIAAARMSYCALASGSIKCWGKNDYGQLGDGTTNQNASPVDVLGISTATQLIAGFDHFCARLSDGTAKCWGNNAEGQLGDGTQTDRSTPTAVVGVTGIASLWGSKYLHTCAVLQTTGAVKCWGYNDRGQLGNNSTSSSLSPVDVSGLTNVSSMALGEGHTCALLSDGTVRCWGANWGNQLGDGSGAESHVPVNADWYSNVTAIAAGPNNMCAMLSGGTVRCWGLYGAMVGRGDQNGESWPDLASAFNVTNAAQISGGINHFCATLSDNTVKCWGGANAVGLPNKTLTSVGGFIP